MNANRIWIIATVIGGAAILALGWFLGVSPKLGEIAIAQEATAQSEAQNLATQAMTAKLKADFEKLPETSAKLDDLRVSIPATADYTGFLDQLGKIADDNTAILTGFTPTDGVILTPGGAAAEAPAEGETVEVSDGTLVAIPTTISASGSFKDLLGFVRDLQRADRLYLVGTLNFSTEDADAGRYTVLVTGYAYLIVDSSVTDASVSVAGDEPETTEVLPTETSSEPPVTVDDLPTVTDVVTGNVGDDPSDSATDEPSETPTETPAP